MRWIGQHIWDLVSRFRSDVYLEDVQNGTIASGGHLGLDSDNKVVKATVTGGGGVQGGDGINVNTGTTPDTVSADLKTNGGIVFETAEMALDLGATSITGTLGPADGGTGIDTVNDTPSTNDVLMWNGSAWTHVPYNTTFTFSVASNKVDNQTSKIVVIGDGQYLSSQTHAVTYNNAGTFSTDPVINQYASGGSADSTDGGYPLTTSSNGASATSSAINYPTLGSNGYTRLRHTVNATFGGTTDSNGPHFDIYFRNKKHFGQSTNSSLTEAQIEALSNNAFCVTTPKSTSTDTYVQSDVNMPSSSGFMYYCYPARISGTPTFKLNGFGTSFTQLAQVSITNPNGYTENYKVWKSPQQYNAAFTFKVE